MYYNHYRNLGVGCARNSRQAIENWYWNRRKRRWIHYTRTTKPGNHSLSGAIRDKYLNQSMDAKMRIEWNEWKDEMDERREIPDEHMKRRYNQYLSYLCRRYALEARERRMRHVQQRKRIKARKRYANFSDIREWYWNVRRINWFSRRRNGGRSSSCIAGSMDAKMRIEWNESKDEMNERREIPDEHMKRRYNQYLSNLCRRFALEARERRSQNWTIKTDDQLVNWVWKRKRSNEMMQNVMITIDNFSEQQLNDKPLLQSPHFTLKVLNNSKWYLAINAASRGVVETSNSSLKSIGIYLHLVNDSSVNSFVSSSYNSTRKMFGNEIAKFQLSILNANGTKMNTRVCDEINFTGGQTGWGWKCFVTRDTLFNKSHKFIIPTKPELRLCLAICLIDIRDKIVNNGVCGGDQLDVHSNSSISDAHYRETTTTTTTTFRHNLDFEFNYDLMNDKEYCDIMFVINGCHIKAHSKLLANKSPVFKALFAGKKLSKSCGENKFLIKDFDSDVFYELIGFIYKGYAPNIEKLDVKLMDAANYFDITDLKVMCDFVCYRALTSVTAVEAIVFAIKYNSFGVKIRALSYIKCSNDDVNTVSNTNTNEQVIDTQNNASNNSDSDDSDSINSIEPDLSPNNKPTIKGQKIDDNAHRLTLVGYSFSDREREKIIDFQIYVINPRRKYFDIQRHKWQVLITYSGAIFGMRCATLVPGGIRMRRTHSSRHSPNPVWRATGNYQWNTHLFLQLSFSSRTSDHIKIDYGTYNLEACQILIAHDLENPELLF